MEVALIQSSLFWEDPEANRKHFSKKIEALGKASDLIVLPEMFTTGFTMNPQNISGEEGSLTLEWMKQQAFRTDAALVGSVVFLEGKQYYNRLIFMKPDGQFDTYDKRHTFTLAGEDKVYQKGTHRNVIHFRGFTFCPLICYDLRFPVWSRNTDNYDVLIYVANWPSPRVSAWDTLLRARAIENMAYVLGVNRVGTDPNDLDYSGHSAIYDSMGERIAYSEEEAVLRLTLSKNHLEHTRDSFRFLEDRDSFTLRS
jgi:omega-amidase